MAGALYPDDEASTVVNVCPSCWTQALALSAANRHGCFVTFVAGGAGRAWTCMVSKGDVVRGIGVGATQEEALSTALEHLGVAP